MPEAAENYDNDLLALHLAKASASLPGPDYYEVLRWIHEILAPAIYVEIGVRHGDSLRLALPQTTCIGIDPEPIINSSLPPNTCLFTMTSDKFFATRAGVLNGKGTMLAFLDGLHLFEQALSDFINLEKLARRNSMIVIHDCLPLDRITSARTRSTHFYSGDVWKLAMCLKAHRPDLRMKVVRTSPSGLCLVTGLDPRSRLLEQRYERLVAEYVPLGFEVFTNSSNDMPESIPNTFEAVQSCIAELLQPSGMSRWDRLKHRLGSR